MEHLHKLTIQLDLADKRHAGESCELSFVLFFNNYFYLAALGLSCSMWDLVP